MSHPTALPQGWEQSSTPSGQPFFIDHNTHTTTFIDPRSGKPSPPVDSIQLPGDALPDGWEARRTPGPSSKIYFVDHNTRSTTFNDPRSGIPIPSEDSVEMPGKELPRGWEAKRTSEGKVYFSDHNLRKTSWEDPRGREEWCSKSELPEGWRVWKTECGVRYAIGEGEREERRKGSKL
ncbi:hypothetical protein BGZ60DRAFT_525439 [Tricladium varicosporioides]|nr:hypothetical protein BGZ60DRAFT_525439 [Hymenoscyphus varicosporioides]